MRRRLGLAGMLAVASLAAGCGGSSPDQDDAAGDGGTELSEDDGDDSGGGGGGDAVSACDLVTLDQLSEALDREIILDPNANNDVTCSYLSQGAGAVVISINVFEDAGSAADVVEVSLDVDEDGEEIDIGEGGYVIFDGAQVGFAYEGNHYQVNLGMATLSGGDPTELTITVARLIESNL